MLTLAVWPRAGAVFGVRVVDASKTYAEDVIERTAHAHRIELTTMENRFDHHSNSTIGLRAEVSSLTPTRVILTEWFSAGADTATFID